VRHEEILFPSVCGNSGASVVLSYPIKLSCIIGGIQQGGSVKYLTNINQNPFVSVVQRTKSRYQSNRRILLALATSILLSLAMVGATLPASANVSSAPNPYTKLLIVKALKDDYLDKACKSNHLVDLLYESYSDFINSEESGFRDQYWERFNQDSESLKSHARFFSKWLAKNKGKFPKSARKSVSTMASELKKEVRLLNALTNSENMEELYFAWDNFDSHLFNTSYASGKIRKSLKLPDRNRINSCP
jgi:hypothetical protein